jgi:hypothetical protein
VTDRARVVEVGCVEGEPHAPAHRRLSALELVEGDVHAAIGQDTQCAFHAFHPNERPEIAPLAAGVREQAAVRAAHVAEHRPVGHRQELLLAGLQAAADLPTRLLDREGRPEKAGQVAGQAGCHRRVLAGLAESLCRRADAVCWHDWLLTAVGAVLRWVVHYSAQQRHGPALPQIAHPLHFGSMRPGRRSLRLIELASLLVLLVLAGCRVAETGQAATATSQAAPATSQSAPVAQKPAGGSVEVDRERTARDATWAPGQLRAHFEKHGKEGPWPSESAYDAAAREAIRVGTSFTYVDRESNAERLGFYVKDANRFLGMTRDGRRITTQFRPDRGEAYVRGLNRSTYR